MKETKPSPSVYLIKPKYIFKTPFLKYDLQNPTNRQAQNEELTEYFNYGFNEDTMNIYVKLVSRMLKVLDHKKNLQYFDEPSQLMRLNDQIPMDLGGFGKFYDPELFKNDFIENDEELLKNFLFNIVKATWINGKQYPTYPMLEFVKSMYPPKPSDKQTQQQANLEFEDNPLPSMIEQISRNLEKKYEQTMKKLIEQKNQPKQLHPSSLPFKKSIKFEKKPKIQIQQKQPEKPEQKKKQRQKQKGRERQKQREKKKKQRSSSSSSSESSSSGSSSDSSSESQDERRKRRKDKRTDRKGDRRDDRRESSRRKEKRSRSRDRKGTKERKDSKHGSSRYESKDKDRREKKRSDHRSRSRDHKRSRR